MDTPALSPLDLADGGILGDRVYESIAGAIIDGRLSPGEQVRDVELARQLGVSRTPVREALQRLEHFGLVEVAVGRYTRVSEITDAQRRDTAEYTAYFMGNAVRIALGRCSDAELAAILIVADEVLAASKTGPILRVFETSSRMFELIVRATGNTLFTGIVRETAVAIQRNLRGWDPFLQDPMARTEGFERLHAAIRGRDGDAAEQAVRYLHIID